MTICQMNPQAAYLCKTRIHNVKLSFIKLLSLGLPHNSAPKRRQGLGPQTGLTAQPPQTGVLVGPVKKATWSLDRGPMAVGLT